MELAKSRLEGNNEGEIYHAWSGIDTMSSDKSSLNTSISKTSARSQSKSRASSKHLILSAAKRQEAAAEFAANEATLEVLLEQDQQLVELQKLEAEDKRRIAEQEAEVLKRHEEAARMRAKHEMQENAARCKLLEDKCHERKRLEPLKTLNASKAHIQIYEQSGTEEEDQEDMRDLFHDCQFKKWRKSIVNIIEICQFRILLHSKLRHIHKKTVMPL